MNQLPKCQHFPLTIFSNTNTAFNIVKPQGGKRIQTGQLRFQRDTEIVFFFCAAAVKKPSLINFLHTDWTMLQWFASLQLH